MNRFIPYLGVVAALAFSILFANVFTARPSHSEVVNTLPDLSVPPDFTSRDTLSRTSSESNPVAKNTIEASRKAISEKVEPPATTSPAAASVGAEIPAESVTAPPSSEGNASLDTSANILRNALVNIVCYVSGRSGLRSISGSGIFIDPKGIILTNAHIAQYFLLADRNVSCAIRSGSPAIEKYTASLVYISPSWITANSKVLTEANPIGTGEYDFALLAVSKSVSNSPLPPSFPSIPLAATPPSPGTPVVIASYGAQFLDPNQIQSFLFPTIVFGSIKDVFTFAERTIDIFSLGGSAAAQEGSSGGGVANSKGELIGTITTSTVKGDTSTRSLNAITASYIRAEYASDTGKPLNLLLSGSVNDAIAVFSSQAKGLEAFLVAELVK